MTKHLQSTQRNATRARASDRPKGLPRRSRAAAKAGWSPERRARQSALIRGWQPWRRSTGPKTDAGKARCAMNALKHGLRSRATIEEFQRVRYAIRLAACNNEIMRLFIRVRDARPELKPVYARLLLAATESLKRFRETAPWKRIAACHAEARKGEGGKSNDRTNGRANYPMRPISCERAGERAHGHGRSRATSLSGREGSSVLWPSNGVGSRGEIA